MKKKRREDRIPRFFQFCLEQNSCTHAQSLSSMISEEWGVLSTIISVAQVRTDDTGKWDTKSDVTAERK